MRKKGIADRYKRANLEQIVRRLIIASVLSVLSLAAFFALYLLLVKKLSFSILGNEIKISALVYLFLCLLLFGLATWIIFTVRRRRYETMLIEFYERFQNVGLKNFDGGSPMYKKFVSGLYKFTRADIVDKKLSNPDVLAGLCIVFGSSFLYEFKGNYLYFQMVDDTTSKITLADKWIAEYSYHSMVIAGTGLGKTYLTALLMGIYASYENTRCVVIDKKAISYKTYGIHEHENYYGSSLAASDNLMRVIKNFHRELDSGFQYDGLTLVVIEEYISLLDDLPDKEKKEVVRIFMSFARLCREFGYRIIITAQSIPAIYFSSAADRNNFQSRFLLGDAESTTVDMLFPEKSSFETCAQGEGYYRIVGSASHSDNYYMAEPQRFTVRDSVTDKVALGRSIIEMLDRYSMVDETPPTEAQSGAGKAAQSL